MAKAMFGAGCFWGVESAFRQIKGVTDVTVGYSGGDMPEPSYEDVCSSTTGHAEVVLVEYDDKRVRYEDLLNVFWQIHDPTQVNRQGPDVGTQYRTAIFYFDDAQKAAAEQSKANAQEHFRRPIATEITPASEFWRAEDYHQRYEEKRHGAMARLFGGWKR
jgi:peptide-methionine (S)-S-oxide reductase